MNQKKLAVLGIVLAGVVAEGLLVLVWASIIPTCGCQNTNGQPYPWCPQPPCPAWEALNIESSRLNSPTSMTLNIRNAGIAQVTLIAYYVRDPLNNQYSNTNWSGPTIPIDSLAPINVQVNGASFTFQQGTAYTVTMVTSRNSQFTFTALV